MKLLYIDCGMGAAGDMLSAALYELLPDKAGFLKKLNSLGIPGVEFLPEKSVKCGITGTHFRVIVHGEEEECHCHDHDHHHHDHGHHHYHSHDHHHHHSHGSMASIRAAVSAMPIPVMAKLDIMGVYGEIAEAESHVHGVSVNEIHFHEVGSLDALADITAVCLMLRELDADKIICSPIHVGSGTVRCAHGVLPVPAPATAHILREVPIYGGAISGELCTPTGAALLKHFVTEFGDMPVMKPSAIGYGMGKKDFPRANCVRCILGTTEDAGEEVLELSCNIDDMTGEALGFALEQLLKGGALEAFTTPVGMKKSRPGVLFTVLCRETDREKMVKLLMKHTTTLGVREQLCRRHTLSRRAETVSTPWGNVRRKVSTGFGVERGKYEHDDLAAIAEKNGLSLSEILRQLP